MPQNTCRAVADHLLGFDGQSALTLIFPLNPYCSSEEEEFVVSDNDAESDAVKSNDDSDFGSTGNGPRFRGSAWSRKPVKRRWNMRQSRQRRRPRGYSDDEELEETEDEEEDEIGTAAFHIFKWAVQRVLWCQW